MFFRRFAIRWTVIGTLLASGMVCRCALAQNSTAQWRQYAALNPQQQTAFLRDVLVDRFDQAAALALPDEQRQKMSRRLSEVMQRVETGENLSSAGFSRLLREVAEVERAAIDQLSLRYRVLVYSRFRTDRTEYDRRMASWRQVMADWQASPTKDRDGLLALSWLNQALQRMQYDEAAVLPPAPRFGAALAHAPAPPADLTPGLAGAAQQRTELEITLPSVAVDSPQLAALPTDLANTVPTNPSTIAERTSPQLHRVEKPPLPDVALPPRTVRREVQPVIDIPETPADSRLDTTDPAPALPVVQVDLQQLAERVQGYNQMFRGLLGKLQREGDWQIDQLADALAELSDLADRRVQLSLYINLISAEERGQTGELLSLDPAVAILGGKIFAAREALPPKAGQRDFRASALDELSRRLALLAAKRAKD